MPDQAQGLRELVAGTVVILKPDESLTPCADPIDYRKLWQDFKAESSTMLERRKFPQEYANELVGWSVDLKDMDDVRELVEHFFFSGIKHVLSESELAETFARVRADLLIKTPSEADR